MPELFSTESELGVLSILLRNPERYYDYTALRPEFFSSTQHQILFENISKMIQEGLHPDKSLVTQRLSDKGKLDVVGRGLIDKLSGSEYSSQNYKEYAKNISHSFIAKNLISIGPEISEYINQKQDVLSVASRVTQKITNLIGSAITQETRSTGDLVPAYEQNFQKRMENPNQRFFITGFKDIDTTTGGIAPGELWITAARPSIGKSSWLVSSVLECAKAGLVCLLFSKEMDWESLMDRMVAVESGLPLYKIRNGIVTKEEFEQVKRAIEVCKDLPIFIDSNFSGNIDYIASVVRKFKQNEQVDLVYVDYVQLLAERDGQSTHELGRISRALKILASELRIGVHLASQLNREVESREDKKPVLSDMRQSGNLEEDADVVAFLYRDEYYNQQSEFRGKMEYIIRKNRNGPTGTITLNFNKETTKVY